MSCDFRIFVVVKGELRTRGHIGVKTRKKYRLGESYVALMLLLCSSYSGWELEGYHNCLVEMVCRYLQLESGNTYLQYTLTTKESFHVKNLEMSGGLINFADVLFFARIAITYIKNCNTPLLL